jgi:DNA-binding beta-propeller fold protein YncE
VFKASYKVPKDATKLDIRVYLHGEQIGEDKYTVYPVRSLARVAAWVSLWSCRSACDSSQTIALPVEIARVIGSGVATVDALFSPSAQKATKLRQPRDVAISSDGAFLCVTDVDNQQVLVYSGIDNRLLKRLGDSVHMDGDMSDHTDTKPVAGRLHHPWGVAISHNCEHVAVTDSFHHCIQVFNVADGSVYKLIGSGRGSSPGALNRPAGLVFDKRGNVFVCDSSNHRIQMFSERGKALRCFGDGEGPLEGQLRYPLGIDISSDDSTLYVCDRSVLLCCRACPQGVTSLAMPSVFCTFCSKNHRIAVFDVLTGECVRTFGQPHLSQPISISLSSDDSSVFVRDNDCDRVIVFSPDGKRLCVLGQTDENSPDNFPGRLSQGAGMTVTPLGHLYAVDKSSATVVVLRAPLQVDDGQSTHSRASAGAQSIITTVSGLLGRDSVVASLSSSSHRRSHKTSRRSDSTSTLTGNPSSQHRLSLPDSTVVSVRATQSPPVQRREPMKPDSPRGRTSSIREFAARLDSECDFDEPPLVQPRQMESSRRKERTQRSPEPRHEVFEKLSDDDDYRRRSERRKPESERVPSRKHRSKSPEDRHAVSISSSTRTPSTESIVGVTRIRLTRRLI